MSPPESSYQAALEQADPSQVLAITAKAGPIDRLGTFTNLKSLDLTGNPNVRDFAFLRELPNLEELYLADLGLSAIPPEVEGLTKLTTLFLGKNAISDLTPLSRLPSLIDLSLESCGLKKLPDAVLVLKGLEVLGLYGNDITSLTALKALPNLRALYVGQNRIRKIPRELCKLKHLRILDLVGNYLLKEPGALWDLTQLEDLGVSNGRTSQVIGPGVYRLTNLRALTLDFRQDGSRDLLEGLRGVGALTKLEQLIIQGANLKRLPDEIRALTSLRELVVRDKSLEDIGALRDLPALEKLDLERCSLVTVPEGFATLKGLKEVKLSHNKITSVPGLRDLPALEHLELFNKLPALPESLGTLRALRVLRISGDHCEVGFLASLEQLQELYLGDLRFTELPATLGRLRHLTIFREEAGDDSYLTRLPALEHLKVHQPTFRLPVLPGLRALHVGTRSGANEGVFDLDALAQMPELRELRLHRTTTIQALPASIATATGLEELTLEFLEELTDLSALRGLERLRVFKAEYLTKLEALPASFGSLQALEHVTLKNLDVLTDLTALGNLDHLRSLDLQSLDELEALPTSFERLDRLETVKLRSMSALKDISALARVPSLRTLKVDYCKALRRRAIAEVEDAIASRVSEAGAPLHMSYARFMESGAYLELEGKEDASRTYGFPLWFATPDVLRSAIEDFSWTGDYRENEDFEDSEEIAILTDPKSDLVPLAILDLGWPGCEGQHIDANVKEIFLVDTASPHNPVLIWGHDGSPTPLHPNFDAFLANLRDFRPEP